VVAQELERMTPRAERVRIMHFVYFIASRTLANVDWLATGKAA